MVVKVSPCSQDLIDGGFSDIPHLTLKALRISNFKCPISNLFDVGSCWKLVLIPAFSGTVHGFNKCFSPKAEGCT